MVMSYFGFSFRCVRCSAKSTPLRLYRSFAQHNSRNVVDMAQALMADKPAISPLPRAKAGTLTPTSDAFETQIFERGRLHF